MHAKLFHATGTCQTLAYVIDGDPVTFCGNGVRASKTAAIEDDSGTKTATDGALSGYAPC